MCQQRHQLGPSCLLLMPLNISFVVSPKRSKAGRKKSKYGKSLILHTIYALPLLKHTVHTSAHISRTFVCVIFKWEHVLKVKCGRGGCESR